MIKKAKLHPEPRTIPELSLNYQFWKGPMVDTKVHDYSGNGNTGTISGSAPYTYPGLSFNGTDQYVTVTDNDALDFGFGDFSISFWCNISASGGYILHKTTALHFGYDIYIDATRGVSLTVKGIGGTAAYSEYVVPYDEWHHIAYSCDVSGNLIMYLDGAPVATVATGPIEDLTTVQNLTIGANGTPQYFFDGLLDDIRIYKGKALTAQEVKSIYSLQKHRYKGQ